MSKRPQTHARMEKGRVIQRDFSMAQELLMERMYGYNWKKKVRLAEQSKLDSLNTTPEVEIERKL